jgi:hypothetical protein
MSDDWGQLIDGLLVGAGGLGSGTPQSAAPQPSLELWLQDTENRWSRWGASGGWESQAKAPVGAPDDAPESEIVWLRGPDGLFQRVERP